jgi:hypothetical protein
MDLSGIFTQQITLQSPTGATAYGDETWGAQRVINVRIQTELRRVDGPAGTAYVPVDSLLTDQAIADGDRYWPPGANTTDPTQAQRMGKVTSAPTLDGSYQLWKVDL